MYFSLTKISRNQKLGPMPASTSSRSTCPDSCPLKGQGGCYAEYGPMSIFWKKVDRGEAGGDFDTFVKEVEQLPRRQMWRYGQAGDLPGEGDEIDREQMVRLAKANRGRPVIAFTHKPPTEENIETLNLARDLGFSVNLSANNVEHADELMIHGMNVVVVLPEEYARQNSETKTEYRKRLNELPKHTPAGARIAVCPATFTDTNCLQCGACAQTKPRGAIIGFPAHGTKKKQVSEMALAPGAALRGT
jgi:ferredoxin